LDAAETAACAAPRSLFALLHAASPAPTALPNCSTESVRPASGEAFLPPLLLLLVVVVVLLLLLLPSPPPLPTLLLVLELLPRSVR
jgi:hypothetical protein